MSREPWDGPWPFPNPQRRSTTVRWRAADGTATVDVKVWWQSLPEPTCAGRYLVEGRLHTHGPDGERSSFWHTIGKPVMVPAGGRYSADRLRSITLDAVDGFNPERFAELVAAATR